MVKTGYKQTEVGEIPEDWLVSEVSKIAKTGSGTTPPRARMDRYYRDGRHCWVKTLDLNNSSINFTSEKITDIAIKETSLRLYPKNSVLVAMYGGFNQIGRTGILAIPAAVNQAISVIEPENEKLDPLYLLHTLNFKVEYWREVASSSRKDPNITSGDIRAFKIPHPRYVQEQQSIASALTDVDTLIACLEKLIEKKRDIKTATMQQLLTGKKRLPGFGEGKGTKQTELGEIPEDWDVRKYGDTFAFLSTANNSRADLSEDGDVEYIHYGDIHTRLHFKLDLERQNLPKIDRSKLRSPAFVADGDVVMADASEDYEGIGKSIEILNVGTRRVVSGLHTFLLRDTERRYANGFRGYLHSIPAIKRAFDTLATGLKVYGLSKNSLKGVSIPVPPFDEQVEIVKVISCMDDELHLLKEKLSKAKAIKQGMMQELLTGRTRLV